MLTNRKDQVKFKESADDLQVLFRFFLFSFNDLRCTWTISQVFGRLDKLQAERDQLLIGNLSELKLKITIVVKYVSDQVKTTVSKVK